MSVAVGSNLKIRSSAYHVFRGPASPELFSLLCYLLLSESSSLPSYEVESVPLSQFFSRTGPGLGFSGSSHSTWLGGLGCAGNYKAVHTKACTHAWTPASSKPSFFWGAVSESNWGGSA